ncbi:MAG: hypothetical protein QW379_04790 [Thermoplasmata archaeon]
MAGSKESESGADSKPPPPFLIYRNKLYVLSKKPPSLNHIEAEEERRAIREEELHIGGPRRDVVARPRTPRRLCRAARPRPYVKGCLRHIEKPHPHLCPAPPRKRVRRLLPRSIE